MNDRTQVLWLWLDHDKFGCGRRQFVAQIGNKWVYLTQIANGARSKISKSEFEIAARQTRGGEIDKTRARRRLRRNAKEFGIETATLKETLRSLT